MIITTAPVQAPATPEVPSGLLIGGSWRPASGRATFTFHDPATDEVLAEVADASPGDGVAAIEAAAAAGDAVAALSPRARAQVLRRVEAVVRERIDDLAMLITREMGKPLAESRAEVGYAADYFGWYADEAVRIHGDLRTSPSGTTRIMVQHRPVGPCLLVTPWNFPLAMAARKVAPAIAAGCPSVLKPAEQTPLSSLVLAQIVADAGALPGTVNVVTTSDAASVVRAIIGSGRARKLSFTGSTAVGKLLLEQCGRHVMRTSMELGGNAPFIVFEDADLEEAVEGAMIAKLRNMGQACTAANRFLVHADVVEEFTARLASRMAALTVGPGWETGSDIGPLIDDDAVAKHERLLQDALGRGAILHTGGHPPDGRFVRPTLITDVAPGSALLHEEIFAPLAPVMAFSTEEEAIAMANDTEYGLVGYVFTTDLDRALRAADRIQTGMLGINLGVVSNAAAPFGGIKASGLGREGSTEGLAEYLDTSYVAVPR